MKTLGLEWLETLGRECNLVWRLHSLKLNQCGRKICWKYFILRCQSWISIDICSIENVSKRIKFWFIETKVSEIIGTVFNLRGPVARSINSTIHRTLIFFKLSKFVQLLVKPKRKFGSFKFNSLSKRYEFNIPVIFLFILLHHFAEF